MNSLFLRKNNKGSTLIIVIVVVALIAILATTTLSAAMLNYRMKIVGSESKKSFYTAEEAVDQLYACFGMLTMTNLNEAYKDQMATITRQDASGASYLVSNEKCNTELRSKFAIETVQDLFGVTSWAPTYPADGKKYPAELSVTTPDVVKNVRTLMNSYIEDYDASNPIISVKSVGACRVVEQKSDRYDNLYNYWVEIDNVAIEYKNEQGYFANVTVDASIGLPDLLIAFTDVSDASLVTFGDYTIIGCDGVEVSTGALNLNKGKIYAGAGSVGGFKLNFNTSFTSNDVSTLNTPGDIILDGYGSGAGTIFTLGYQSKLYCNNITTTESSSHATINLAGSAFVKDDLDVNGSNNVVNVNGNYVGFSNAGNSTNNNHIQSSAMMLNGSYCTLNMNNITTLVLGGRSYLRLNTDAGTQSYQLGESVSLRATQETYLVPDAFIKGTGTYADRYYTNPVAYASSGNVEIKIPTDFFANDWLVESEPVKAITSGGFTYYYFNLKEDCHDDYINAIVGYDSSKGVNVYIESLRRVLFADILELQQQAVIKNAVEKGSLVYTAGAMIHVALDDKINAVNQTNSIIKNVYDSDKFATLKRDMESRFTLVNKILYEPEFFTNNAILQGDKSLATDVQYRYNQDGVPGTLVMDGKNIDISTMTDPSAEVFGNFIDAVALTKLASVSPFEATGDDGFKVYCVGKSVGSGVVDVSSLGITKGLIITDGDVVLKNATFDGLIFAKGKVTIEGGANVTNTYGGLDNMLSKLTAEDRATVQGLFKSWGATDTTESENALDYNIAGITYKHIIDFNNWRKSAPTVIDGADTPKDGGDDADADAPAAAFEPGVTK